MDMSLYFHGSWEYLPDKNDTYVTYIIHILSFLETTRTVLDNFQGQTLYILIQSMLLTATPVKKCRKQAFCFCFVNLKCMKI